MKIRSLWLILFALTVFSLLAGWNWYQTRASLDRAAYPQAEAIAPPTLNPDRLWADLKALSFQRYEESDRQRARNYIVQELQAAGWTTQIQSFDGGSNILAERAGSNPQAGTILLGAHYDTVQPAPGADDNASAVATVLEAARLLKPTTPRTLQLALFDLEEVGLIGSSIFVEKLLQPETIQGAVILDMVGYACHQAGCQSYPPLPIQPPSDKGEFLAAIGDQGHPALTESFAKAGRSNLPPVFTLSIPTLGGLTPDLVRSDHTPFWKKGLGAILLTDTANFRNPHYHQPSDTLETIDRPFFLGSAQIVVNAVTDLLNSDR